MKKRFIIILCVVSMLIAPVLGCQQNAPAATTTQAGTTAAAATTAATEATTAAASAEEQIQLSFWHRGSGTGGYTLTFVTPMFEKDRPNVKVDDQMMGNDYADALRLALAADSAPDLFEVGTGLGFMTVTASAEAGYIQPLTPLLNDEELDLANKIDPPLINLSKIMYNDEYYSFPLYKAFYVMLINHDLFAKAGLDPASPPATFEEVAVAAKQISDVGNGEFYGFGLHLGQNNILYRVIDMMEGVTSGAGLYGFNYNTTRFDFAPHKPYLELLVQMKKDGSILPGEATTDVEQMRSKFNQGVVGMYIDGSWATGVYDATDMQNDFEWSFAHMPALNNNNPRNVGYAYYNNEFCVYSKTKYPELSMEYYKYLLRNSLIQATEYANGPVSYTKDPVEAANAEYKYNGEKLKWLNEATTDYAPYSIEPNTIITLTGDNRDIVLNEALVNAFAGDNIDFDRLLDDLTKRYNEALDIALSEGKIKQEELYR